MPKAVRRNCMLAFWNVASLGQVIAPTLTDARGAKQRPNALFGRQRAFGCFILFSIPFLSNLHILNLFSAALIQMLVSSATPPLADCGVKQVVSQLSGAGATGYFPFSTDAPFYFSCRVSLNL